MQKTVFGEKRSNMKKYIFFDFDGTLFDTAEGVTKCVQYALKKLGIEAELNELMCFCGPPLFDMFSEKYGMDAETANKAISIYRERYSPIGWTECKPFDGMPELVRRLRSEGFKVAVTTSKPTEFTRRILANFGLENDFDLISGAEFDGTRSKKWEVIDYALEHFGIAPDEAILVGDRKYDVIGAKKCGVSCVGVRFGYAEPDELESHGAVYVAEDTEDLYDFLTK